MLVTTLDHAAGNDYLAARFQKAYAFLNRDDLGSLPLGRVDIDGDAVFANVQEYDTVPAEEKQLEAHRRYYDVQFVVSGEEVMQYAPLEGLAKVQPFDEDADFGLYCTPSCCVRATWPCSHPKTPTSRDARSTPHAACARSSSRCSCSAHGSPGRKRSVVLPVRARMRRRHMVHGLHRGRRRTRARA